MIPDPSLSVRDPGPAAAGVGRDFLIRSEEQLRVATERVVAGVARLEKFVVTETKTITVEVAHEEVRLVHLPAAGEGDTAAPSPRVGQLNNARWLYVGREEIVVTKRVVPTERVRLEVVSVVEQRQITEEIRREQFDDGVLPVETSAKR